MNSKSNKRVVINMVAITFLLMFIIAGLTLEPILAGKDVPSCKVDEDCSVLVHVSTNVTVSCGESGLCECDHTLNIENDNMQVLPTNVKADQHSLYTYKYKCSFLINEPCSAMTCPEAAGCLRSRGVCTCLLPSVFGTYHKNDMNMCYWPAKSPRKYGQLCDPTPDDGLRRCDVSVNNTGYDCHTVEGEEYGRCTCPPETPFRGIVKEDECFAYPGPTFKGNRCEQEFQMYFLGSPQPYSSQCPEGKVLLEDNKPICVFRNDSRVANCYTTKGNRCEQEFQIYTFGPLFGSMGPYNMQCPEGKVLLEDNKDICVSRNDPDVADCFTTTEPTDLGCWINNQPTLLIRLEGSDARLDWPYKERDDAKHKCFAVARDGGYSFFALGNKGQCWGGHREDYKNQGEARSCPADGKGSYGVIHAYGIY